MNFYIKNLKISNFLSFFGENHVEIQPFTAIICNFDEGRSDFFKAIDFVFGGLVNDFRFQKEELNNLINPVFVKNADKLADKQCYVEVTLHLFRKKQNLQMRRALENGRIKYYIDEGVVSVLNYNKRLESLNVHVRKKNVIFYLEYFTRAVFGSPKALEQVITTILSTPFMLDEWKKSKNKVKRLQDLEQLLANKEYFHTEHSCQIIADFLRIYDAVTEGKENIKKRILREIFDSLDEEDSLPSSPNPNDESLILEAESTRKLNRISVLNNDEERLRELKYRALRTKAVLVAKIYHDKIIVARDPNFAFVLEAQINQLEALANAKENDLKNLPRRLKEAEKEFNNISKNISYELIKSKDIADSRNQPRLTPYGRFSDHIRYSHPNYNLLKGILGKEIFYGYLIDTLEEARLCLQNLKRNKCENRECFIILEDYSPDFKDLILASDEQGIDIDNLEKLQIFLCKLKKYGLIKSVPILVNQGFNFKPDWEERGRDVIFVPSNTFITSENVITQTNDVEGTFGDDEELLRTLNNLITAQELKIYEIKDLRQREFELLDEINYLENDIDYLILSMPSGEGEERLYPDLYRRAPQSETLEEREQNLKILQDELRAINTALNNLEREKRELLASSHWIKRLPRNSYINSVSLKEKAAMFYDRELERIKEVVTQDDVDFYKSSEEFRDMFVESLRQDLEDLRSKLERERNATNDLEEERKRKLRPLTEHCSQYLFYTFQHILDNVIPFVDLIFDQSNDHLQLVTSLNKDEVRVVDFKNLSKQLKFVVVLSTFLQIAVFEKMPIMILDDMEKKFFLGNVIDAGLSAEVLNRLLPDTEKTCYDLKMRIGEYLNYFVRKNTPKPSIRQSRVTAEYINGPCQIIFFSSGDLSLAGDSVALLSRKLLPDEFITCEIPYYSTISMLNFE